MRTKKLAYGLLLVVLLPVKGDVPDGACIAHLRDEKCTQNFFRKP